MEQNELADWLGKTITTVKPYQNTVLGVVLLLAVGAAAYTWWSRHSGASSSEAWNQFYTALDKGDLSKLSEVIEKYPSSRAAQCAAVALGDIHLNYGCEMLFHNKATANDELHKAVQQYTWARDNSRDSMLLERAAFGLARAREATGELDQARRLYAEVEKSWPKGAYAVQAASRVSDLKKDSTKAWYDRFAKYDPRPALSDEPGTPGKRPSFNPEESLREDGPVFELPKGKFGPKPEGGATKEPEENKPPAEPDAKAPPAKPDGAEPAAKPETDKPAEPAQKDAPEKSGSGASSQSSD